LAQARLRALEEGLPVIRSTPTGISALIDADGTVVKALPYQQAGAITASLPPARTPTLFARFGLAATWALALALCALGIALRRALR
jgi:apolipoprotein N-acyltransferase